MLEFRSRRDLLPIFQARGSHLIASLNWWSAQCTKYVHKMHKICLQNARNMFTKYTKYVYKMHEIKYQQTRYVYKMYNAQNMLTQWIMQKLFQKSPNADNVENMLCQVWKYSFVLCTNRTGQGRNLWEEKEGGSNYRAGTITQQCRHLDAQLHRSRSGWA